MSKEETWEERFDKQVEIGDSYDWDEVSKFLLSDENILFKKEMYPESMVEFDSEKVKSFFSQELEKEYQRGIIDTLQNPPKDYVLSDVYKVILKNAKQEEKDRIIKIIEEEVFWGDTSESWLVEDKDKLLDKIKR